MQDKIMIFDLWILFILLQSIHNKKERTWYKIKLFWHQDQVNRWKQALGDTFILSFLS